MKTTLRRSLLAVAAIFLFVVNTPAQLRAADDEKASDEQIPDVINDAVDPFVPGKERARFLKAAGVDTELDENEFVASAQLEDGFARVFDKWSALIRFDKNGSQASVSLTAISVSNEVAESWMRMADKDLAKIQRELVPDLLARHPVYRRGYAVVVGELQ